MCKESKKATLFNNYPPLHHYLPPFARVPQRRCHMNYFKEVLTMFLGQRKFQLYCGRYRVRKLFFLKGKDFIKNNLICVMIFHFFLGELSLWSKVHTIGLYMSADRCAVQTTWLCKWSATRGLVTHNTSWQQLSPNDSIWSLNHICHENTCENWNCNDEQMKPCDALRLFLWLFREKIQSFVLQTAPSGVYF